MRPAGAAVACRGRNPMPYAHAPQRPGRRGPAGRRQFSDAMRCRHHGMSVSGLDAEIEQECGSISRTSNSSGNSPAEQDHHQARWTPSPPGGRTPRTATSKWVNSAPPQRPHQPGKKTRAAELHQAARSGMAHQQHRCLHHLFEKRPAPGRAHTIVE